MIKKVPREELEALFEVLYSSKEIDGKAYSGTYDETLYRFYAYKIKRHINKAFTQKGVIPLRLLSFSIYELENQFIQSAPFLSYEIESKFRLFVVLNSESVFTKFIEENFVSLEKSGLEIAKNSVSSAVVDAFQEIGLEISRLDSNFFNFYEDKIIEVSYVGKLLEKDIEFKLLFDKSLFESEVIPKYISVKPTSLEKTYIKYFLSKM